METIQLIEQKVMDWEQEVLFYQKLKKKVNLERSWGQEVARTIDEEISFLKWKISDLSQILYSTAKITDDRYQPAQAPVYDILSANIEQEIRERFLGHKKEVSEGAQSLV